MRRTWDICRFGEGLLEAQRVRETSGPSYCFFPPVLFPGVTHTGSLVCSISPGRPDRTAILLLLLYEHREVSSCAILNIFLPIEPASTHCTINPCSQCHHCPMFLNTRSLHHQVAIPVALHRTLCRGSCALHRILYREELPSDSQGIGATAEKNWS